MKLCIENKRASSRSIPADNHGNLMIGAHNRRAQRRSKATRLGLMLGLLLTLALALMLAGCDDKKTQGQPAEEASESKAAQARQEAKEATGDAAEAIKEAAGRTFDDAKAAVGEKAHAVKEGVEDLGEKAGSALKDAAEKTEDKFSDLASKASEALGLDEKEDHKEGGGLTDSFLINKNFSLKKINGADFSGSAGLGTPKIEFGPGFIVTGKVCNNFNGSGQLADGRLKVLGIASTRMACTDEDLSQLEKRFFSMLESGADISMSGSFLTFKQGDSTFVFEEDAAAK